MSRPFPSQPARKFRRISPPRPAANRSRAEKHRRRSPRPAPLPGPRTRRTPPRRRLPPKRSQSASGLSRASASRPTACRSFSFNATTQDWRTHDGVDLAALAGEPVRAACSGTVTAVYDDEFLGTTVVISHPEGYETCYSNLAAMPAVSAGMRVTAGDTIGSVGASALLESASSSHLHFAVRQDGKSVDPARFID